MKWKFFSVAKSLNAKDEHWSADYNCTTWKWKEIMDFDALWTCSHQHVGHFHTEISVSISYKQSENFYVVSDTEGAKCLHICVLQMKGLNLIAEDTALKRSLVYLFFHLKPHIEKCCGPKLANMSSLPCCLPCRTKYA